MEEEALIVTRSTMPLNSLLRRWGSARQCVGMQLFAHRIDGIEEVCTRAVHFVDECDTWNAVFFRLAPYGLGLRLNTGDEQNTATAPSRTRSERSTSTVKSTWPGVSMMLILAPFQKTVVAAEVMVMPRSCSCSIQSIVAAPSCTSPILCRRPE